MKQTVRTPSLIAALMLASAAVPVQAELGNGSTLQFGAGSKVSLEASPGFWVDTPIEAASGVVIGALQADSSIDAPFRLFEQATQHLSGEPVAVIEADTGSAILDFSAWAMSWHGEVIPLGSGGDNPYGDGAALVTCEGGCSEGNGFTLEYSATLPDGAGLLAGLAYRLQLVGTIR